MPKGDVEGKGNPTIKAGLRFDLSAENGMEVG